MQTSGTTPRWIVSFTRRDVSDRIVENFLEDDRLRLADGVEVLVSGAPPPDAALWFRELGTVSIPASPQGDSWLRRHAAVAQVVPDVRFGQAMKEDAAPAPGTRRREPRAREKAAGNLRQIRAPEAWTISKGRGVTVGVLDSGIREQPDLPVARVPQRKDRPTCRGACLVDDDTGLDDLDGHGTLLAGIIGARDHRHGVAPECDLVPIRVATRGAAALTHVLAGLVWAAREGLDIVCTGITIPARYEDEPPHVCLDRAARLLEERGCLLVAPAGNARDQGNLWLDHPARGSTVLAVGAVHPDGQAWRLGCYLPYGCPGGGVDVYAPGVDVASTYLTSGGSRSLMEVTGTSFAAPHVAGAAALIKSRDPQITPAGLRRRLRDGARHEPNQLEARRGPVKLLDCYEALRLGRNH